MENSKRFGKLEQHHFKFPKIDQGTYCNKIAGTLILLKYKSYLNTRNFRVAQGFINVISADNIKVEQSTTAQ